MHCKPIDFKLDLFCSPDFFTPSMRLKHSFLQESYLNPNLVDIFESLNLIITQIETFYLPPFIESGIHVDDLGGDFTKINWIFKGGGSKMNWYEPIAPDSGITKTMQMGTLYRYYEPDQVKKIYDHSIQGSAIIQAGIPHNITTGHEERFCVSVSYRTRKYHLMTMHETTEVFQNYLV
jgi:hypothetical protein